MSTVERHVLREPTMHEWAWICRRMNAPDLLDGTTDRDVRVERWARELLKRGWAFIDSAAGKRADGSHESWAMLFGRMTGQSLRDLATQPAPKKNGEATA